MTFRFLRMMFALEFLVAIVAVFTAWSEIGGQDALDAMPWGWKAGLGLGLAAAIVVFSSTLLQSEAVLTLRGARWLGLIFVLILAMAAVTYFYALVAASNDASSEPESTTALRPAAERLHAPGKLG